jgi:hypothetical protein
MKSVLRKLMLVFLSVCLLAGCSYFQEDDVAFARRFWKLFCAGDYAAISMVDWSKANFFGQDIAKEYNALPDNDKKSAYAKLLIDVFSQGYKQMSYFFKNVKIFNWRVVKSESNLKVVAVNVVDLSRTFFFHISHENMGKKIVGMLAVAPGYSPELAVKMANYFEQGGTPEGLLKAAQQGKQPDDIFKQGGQNVTQQ